MLEVRPPQPGHAVTPDLRAGELAVLRTLDVMLDRGQGQLTPAQVARAAGLSLSSTSSALRELRSRELAKPWRGRWSIDHTGIPLLSEHDRDFIAAGRS
jgi:hypothetical protein